MENKELINKSKPALKEDVSKYISALMNELKPTKIKVT
jgi:hypothetical protein